jgi:hypothetical protein
MGAAAAREQQYENSSHLEPVNQSRFLDRAFRYFRSRRMQLFERTFQITSETRILDVGGSSAIWGMARVQPRVVLLNLPSALERSALGYPQVGADGLQLPFADGSFDIVFSNSVIEHVGSREEQRQFAAEVRRVGRAYWVQTPNRRFPVELHLMLPLVHFLPRRWQRALIYRFTGWEKIVKPSAAERKYYLEHFLNELNLLDRRALGELFPEARIFGERVLGLSKSLIAARRQDGP